MAMHDDGTTLIRKGTPVSLEDFYNMFVAGGKDPNQVSDNLFLHAPRDAQEYLKSNWANIGMTERPDKFFSNPSNVAAVEAAIAMKKRQAGSAGSTRQGYVGGPTGARLRYMQARQDPTSPSVQTTSAMAAGAPPEAASGQMLDRNVFDARLQEIMREDPRRAALIYHEFTGGRDLAADYAATAKIQGQMQADNLKWRQDLLQKQGTENIERQRKFATMPLDTAVEFAKRHPDYAYDPSTGKFKIWQTAEPPDNAGTLQVGGQPRPFRQRVDATDEEAALLRRGIPYVYGHALPIAPASTPEERLRAATLRNDPLVEAEVAAAEKQTGRQAFPDEVRRLANIANYKKYQQQLQQQQQGFGGFIDRLSSAMMGYKGSETFDTVQTTNKLGTNAGPVSLPSNMLPQVNKPSYDEGVFDSAYGKPRTPIEVGAPSNFMPQANVDPSQLNWWGKFLAHPVDTMGSIMDRFSPATPTDAPSQVYAPPTPVAAPPVPVDSRSWIDKIYPGWQ